MNLCLKYISGFLNSEGGYLYLGIDDYCIAYGINIVQKEFDKLLIGIYSEGKNKTVPPLMPQKYEVKRIPVYNNSRKELYVIAIKVSKNMHKNGTPVLT